MMAKDTSGLDEIKLKIEKLHRFVTAGLCISSVTHEVNNYLGAIMAYAEMLQLETSSGEETKRMLGKIIESVKLCSHLIHGLNTLARVKEELVTLVEIPELMETVLLLRKYYLKTQLITVEKDISNKIQPIMLNLPKFQLAILHLLKNAEENLNNGMSPDKDKIIYISAKEEKKGVKIVIRDNGPPIPEDEVEKLFQPFVSTKGGYHLGLGLYIAKKVVEEHGGILEYDKELGFTLWIPYENPQSSPKVPSNSHSEMR